MSKPDAASGSLESILASIRKSLSEQSVEAGGEERAALFEPAKDGAGRKGGLTRRLAGAAGEGATAGDGKAGDDLADLLEDQTTVPPPTAKPAAASPAASVASAPAAPTAAPITQATPAAASPPDEDPLWFLTRRDEPAPVEAAALPVAAEAQSGAGVRPQAAEPILTPPEVVRATMPPFFGSTAEVLKPEAPQRDAREAAATVRQPPRPAAVASGLAAAVPTAEAPKAGVQPPAVHTLPNGRGAEPGEVKGAAQGDTQYTRALEAAVLELLKPMLAQWLDRNMPRLVGEALKEEAARARAVAESGAKKAQ